MAKRTACLSSTTRHGNLLHRFQLVALRLGSPSIKSVGLAAFKQHGQMNHFGGFGLSAFETRNRNDQIDLPP